MGFQLHSKVPRPALAICLALFVCGMAVILVDIDHPITQSRAWHPYFALMGLALFGFFCWYFVTHTCRHFSSRILGLVTIMLLGLYPISELTRVIVVSGRFYYPEMGASLIAEVIVMWILYLSIIPVFLLVNKNKS